MKKLRIGKIAFGILAWLTSQQAFALSVTCAANVSYAGMTSTGLNIRTMAADEQANSVYYVYDQKANQISPWYDSGHDIETPNALDYLLVRSTSIVLTYSATVQLQAFTDLFDGRTSPPTHLNDDTAGSTCWSPGVSVIP